MGCSGVAHRLLILLVSHAKAPPAKISGKGDGDENFNTHLPHFNVQLSVYILLNVVKSSVISEARFSFGF